MNFETKLMADLKRIMESSDIPDVPTMKDLITRTEVVVSNKSQDIIYLGMGDSA